MARKAGINAALEARDREWAGSGAGNSAGGEQLVLLPQVAEVIGLAAATGKRRGRPPGAKNRRTVELIAWLERKGHKSPQEWLSSLVNAPLLDMAAAAKCEPLDVLKLQVSAAGALLPYWAPKQPTEMETAIKGAVEWVMDGGSARAMDAVMSGDASVVDDLADFPIGIAGWKDEENQEVTDCDVEQVGQDKSDGGQDDQ